MSTGHQNPVGNAEKIAKIVNNINVVFLLGFNVERDDVHRLIPEATNDWVLAKEVFPNLVHSLELAAESRGLDAGPLVRMKVLWNALSRQYPEPTEALVHFRDVFDEQWILDNLAPLVERLRVKAQLEMGDVDSSPAGKLWREPTKDTREHNALQVLWETGATGPASLIKAEEIARRAGWEGEYNSHKDVFVNLFKMELVDSKIGPRGGYWLSPGGCECASQIFEEPS